MGCLVKRQKKGITITNPFEKLLDASNCKAKLVTFTIDQ